MSLKGEGNEDDAMFAKKPLGGNSCASCAKDIINLSGNIAEFNAWKKLPFREPNERLSKVSVYNNLNSFIVRPWIL